MDIPSEAKLIAQSIIEWCYRNEDANEDENYPSHIVENLLQRQKKEMIKKACEWLHSNCYIDDEYLDRFRKAMEE